MEVRKGQKVQEYKISERSEKSRKFTRSGRFKRSVRSKNSIGGSRSVEVQKVFRGLGGPGGLQDARHHMLIATVQNNFTQIKLSPIFKQLCKYNFAEIRYLGYLI